MSLSASASSILLLLVVVLLLTAISATTLYDDDELIPLWTWLPPLPTTPYIKSVKSSVPNVPSSPTTGSSVIQWFNNNHPSKFDNQKFKVCGSGYGQIQPINDLETITSYISDYLIKNNDVLQPKFEIESIYKLVVTGDKTFRMQSGTLEFQYHAHYGMHYLITINDSYKHQIVLHLDAALKFHLLQHTSNKPAKSNNSSSIKILTYNVWNVNPEDPNIEKRTTRYKNRMESWTNAIIKSNADIIGVQEVRYDNTFIQKNNDATNQIQDIMSYLLPYKHYVYRPAMIYTNNQKPFDRVEEGPAIISKYPILSTDYILLPNTKGDPNDVHQRIVLHAVIQTSNETIDVYVTHLSLSESARDKSMIQIWEFMKNGRGASQVLLGDLNAEPSTRGIRFLQGLESLQKTTTTNGELKDAVLYLNQPQFTFPTDKPHKRIDYVFYKSNSLKPLRTSLIGEDDTAGFDFPSDHLGVLVEFINGHH